MGARPPEQTDADGNITQRTPTNLGCRYRSTKSPIDRTYSQLGSGAMSAIEGVSEIFDADAWDVVPGFEGLTDQ